MPEAKLAATSSSHTVARASAMANEERRPKAVVCLRATLAPKSKPRPKLQLSRQ